VTFWLIAVNVLVHLVLQTLSPGQQDAVVNTLGFDPATLRQPVTAIGLLSLVTYQFLHGGWEHLGFNMITLLAFGSGVERALGTLRYLLLYEVAGIAGALLQGVLAQNDNGGVMIGASASISGLFGAFLSLSNLQTSGRGVMGIVPMALLWIGMLALTGILGVGAQGMPVAWIAHIGGFLAGLLYGLALRGGRGRR
jgi:membrane associated rhomboid family serine protease